MRAIDILLAGTKDQRLYLCSLDPKYFALYYFTEYFTFKSPPFHYDLFDDVRRLLDFNDPLLEAVWEVYREGAKTSIAKIAFITWAICFKKREYINVDSYDKGNSEALLFDVTVSLQTNRRIINDFGHLYYRKALKGGDADDEDEADSKKVKRLGSFVTENDIKVEAFSTQQSTRGRLYKNKRPDCYLLDDFENLITIESFPIMGKIKSHIDELRAGLAPGACVLYLGNGLLEEGVVAYIKDLLRKNPMSSMVREIPVVDIYGTVSWPDKYVKTDAEALMVNKEISDPKRRKISLETKRRQLGEAVYEREMMNNPGIAGDYIFDREKIKRDILKCYEPIKTYGAMKLWFDVQPDHKYGIGADTAEGNGNDANASVVIDFSRFPNVVVGTFEDNRMRPNVFGLELSREGYYFNEAFVCPELNNTGWATITTLQDNYENIYTKEDKTKVKNQQQNEYGLRKSPGNKHTIMSNFKTAYENGELEIFDKGLLIEMQHYTKNDLNRMNAEDGVTRHFDKIQAVALAWHVKENVLFGKPQLKPGEKPKVSQFKSKQKPYTGLYQG